MQAPTCVVGLEPPTDGGLPSIGGSSGDPAVSFAERGEVIWKGRQIEPRRVHSRLVPVDQRHVRVGDEDVRATRIAVYHRGLVCRDRPPGRPALSDHVRWHCAQVDITANCPRRQIGSAEEVWTLSPPPSQLVNRLEVHADTRPVRPRLRLLAGEERDDVHAVDLLLVGQRRDYGGHPESGSTNVFHQVEFPCECGVWATTSAHDDAPTSQRCFVHGRAMATGQRRPDL